MSKAAELAKMGEVLTNSQIGGRRNIVYNGAMTIWQRGTTADTASSGDYMCDRWRINFSGLDGNVDWDQETSSTPDGFGYALKISTDASESSLDAADNLKIQQRLEGQDLQQLKKGTSSAEKTTLSFWVKSSVASTYTMELADNDNTRAISKSYTISSADTWEHKTIVFEGDTTGTLTTDNNTSMTWNIYIDAGSNLTSGTFSTSWQSTSDTERVFNTTGWLESTSPEFYITGVQWEVGEQATPFEHRSFGEELALCQRYYIDSRGGKPSEIRIIGESILSSRIGTSIFFPTSMRGTPSITIYSPVNETAGKVALYNDSSVDLGSNFASVVASANGVNYIYNGSGLSVGSHYSFKYSADAEL